MRPTRAILSREGRDMTLVADILETMEYGPAPEASDHVRSWLRHHEKGFGHFIGGKHVAPRGGHWIEVSNPATGAPLASVAQGDAGDVDAAVQAAPAAFPAWSSLPGEARGRYLLALARLIQKRQRFFAVLETMDNGKPIRESRDI